LISQQGLSWEGDKETETGRWRFLLENLPAVHLQLPLTARRPAMSREAMSHRKGRARS